MTVTNSLLAEQRSAMLERAGITVTAYCGSSNRAHDDFYVCQDDVCVEIFSDDDAAYTFAHELAGDLIDQGDLS